MIPQAHRYKRPAEGSLAGGRSRGMPRVTVAFEKDTLEEIAKRAQKDKVSFAEMVRTLIEWALEE